MDGRNLKRKGGRMETHKQTEDRVIDEHIRKIKKISKEDCKGCGHEYPECVSLGVVCPVKWANELREVE